MGERGGGRGGAWRCGERKGNVLSSPRSPPPRPPRLGAPLAGPLLPTAPPAPAPGAGLRRAPRPERLLSSSRSAGRAIPAPRRGARRVAGQGQRAEPTPGLADTGPASLSVPAAVQPRGRLLPGLPRERLRDRRKSVRGGVRASGLPSPPAPKSSRQPESVRKSCRGCVSRYIVKCSCGLNATAQGDTASEPSPCRPRGRDFQVLRFTGGTTRQGSHPKNEDESVPN